MAQIPGPSLVVGSSRGLGAALVEALLRAGAAKVLGVARTPLAAIAHHGWAADRRYQHLKLDVTASGAAGRLEAAVAALPPGPLLVIHNAAAVKSDLTPGGGIDWATLEEINRVGVTGLATTLRATEPHLLARGGILVGISSYAAVAPPVRDPRLAYPASKAYLDMALRTLRQRWRGRVRVVTVHLGNLGSAPPRGWRRLIEPSYAMAATRIVRALGTPRGPERIGYPWPFALVYGLLVPLVPDRLYFAILGRLLGGAPRP
jgi:NAD(P)-dependent dehydrogenase (short-subunit alcohol dehydrogenase family)